MPKKKKAAASASEDDDDDDENKENDSIALCLCLVMALACLIGLTFYLWHNDTHHRYRERQLVKLIRSLRVAVYKAKKRNAPALRTREERAERLAIQHAKNSTPNATHQAQLLAAARTHTLFICAGLGTTGTSALERSFIKLGLRTAKWGHIVQQPSGKSVQSSIMDGLLQKHPTFFAYFNEVDAVLDSPVVDFLPHLLDTYPLARLILTQRDPAVWAQRRAQLHPCTPPPFAAWYGHGALTLNGRPHLAKAGSYERGLPCRRTPAYALQHAIVAWTAYVEAVAKATRPATPILHLDVYREADERLWHKLRTYIDHAGLPGARRRRKLARGPFGCAKGRQYACRHWRKRSVAADANRTAVSQAKALRLLPFWDPAFRKVVERRNATNSTRVNRTMARDDVQNSTAGVDEGDHASVTALDDGSSVSADNGTRAIDEALAAVERAVQSEEAASAPAADA